MRLIGVVLALSLSMAGLGLRAADDAVGSTSSKGTDKSSHAANAKDGRSGPP